MSSTKGNIQRLIEQYMYREGDTHLEEKFSLQPFSLKGASRKQQEAIRSMAQQVGFKDLRGFSSWLKHVELDYYDLIKVASPEG